MRTPHPPRPRSLFALILNIGGLLLLSACGALSLSDGAPRAVGGGGTQEGGRATGELIPAQVEGLELPLQIDVGASLPVLIYGTHPDNCTRFERFETSRSGNTIALDAWAFRPLGGCSGPGSTYQARTSIEGLEPGIYTIEVNASQSAQVAVIGVAAAGALCNSQTSVTISKTRLPATTHPKGSALLLIEGSLPSWCDRLLPISQSISGDVLQLGLDAEGCAMAGMDPALCPNGPKTFALLVPLALPGVGLWRIALNGQALGSMTVVPESDCRFSSAVAIALHAPARVEEQAPFELSLDAHLPSSCAALDPVQVTLGAADLSLALPVRECDASCPASPRNAHAQAHINGLPMGSYSLKVAGSPDLSSSLEVLPSGSCQPISLPPGSIEQVLVTSTLSYTDGVAGQPFDVSIYGSLPPGCWELPSLAGQVVGDALELQTRSSECGPRCDGAGAAFSASASFPDGLPTGDYRVLVDGEPHGSFSVSP